MILMIDNYDSFTYNLVHYLESLGEEVIVKKNDEINILDIEAINPEFIVLSPGPGNPHNSGVCLDVVSELRDKYPILGICLGHQVIAESFGGKIVKAKEPKHGKISHISHDNKGIYNNLPESINVTRYHSLVVDNETLPSCFEVSAYCEDGQIMSMRHNDYLIESVQYHPESIMTDYGKEMLNNFLKAVRRNS